MSRSRKGCNTCKKRHRKCDEAKPTCQTCEAYGLQCEGYALNVRWATGHVSSTMRRRSKAGAEHAIVGRNESWPRHSADTEVSDGVSPQQSQLQSEMSGLAMPVISDLHDGLHTNPRRQEPGPEAETSSLLKEFMGDTVYSLYATTRDSPFPLQLRALAQTTETLRAIIAAMQLYFSSSGTPGPRFQHYSSQSMHLFRRQLDHYDGSLDPGILASGLLICTLNLFQSLPWSPTLKHMINVFGIGRSTLPNLSDPLCHPITRSTIEAMGVMDLPTNVRGRTPRTFGIWKDVRASQAGFSDEGGSMSDPVELISALPRSLLDLLARIEEPDAEEAFLAWPGEVGEIPLCHHWEAYRLAGILNCRKYNRAKSTTEWGNNKGTSHKASIGPSNDVLVARIVAHLDALLEINRRAVYSNYLTTNAVFFPYAAARLEVAVLLRHGHLMDPLRRIKASVLAYAATENSRVLETMLDEAYETQNDFYDLDEECRRRGVEVSLF